MRPGLGAPPSRQGRGPCVHTWYANGRRIPGRPGRRALASAALSQACALHRASSPAATAHGADSGRRRPGASRARNRSRRGSRGVDPKVGLIMTLINAASVSQPGSNFRRVRLGGSLKLGLVMARTGATQDDPSQCHGLGCGVLQRHLFSIQGPVSLSRSSECPQVMRARRRLVEGHLDSRRRRCAHTCKITHCPGSLVGV